MSKSPPIAAKPGTTEIYWNQDADHLPLPHIKSSQKTKRDLELVSLPHFLHDCWKNIHIFLLFYYLTKFPSPVAITPRDIGQYVYCNYLLTRLWRLNLAVNLIFLIKPFFLYDQKVKTKIWVSSERKRFFRWNKKHFSSLLKGFYWSK